MNISWRAIALTFLALFPGQYAAQNELLSADQTQCVSDCLVSPRYFPPNSVLGDIKCSILPYQDTCPGFSNSSSDFPSTPRSKTEEGWFLYKDHTSNKTLISLDISWGPEHDITANYIVGYKISLTKSSRNSNRTSTYLFNYCLSRKLNFHQHLPAKFSLFDHLVNNGTCNQMVDILPGDSYLASIYGLPAMEPPLKVKVQVPDCGYPGIANASACLNRITSHFTDIFCQNKSILITYSIPKDFGKAAVIKLCKLDGECSSSQCSLESSNLYVSVPDKWVGDFSNKNNFILTVHGTDHPNIVSKNVFNFGKCKYETRPIVIIVAGITFALMCAIFIFLLYQSKKFKHCNRSSSGENFDITDNLMEVDPQHSNGPAELQNKIDVVRNLFIVFFNDHKLHEQVVLKLASYFQHHLGFNVFCELFDQHEIFPDMCEWMEKCMKKADKVIVVWSKEAFEIWNECENNDSFVVTNCDLFTPVLKMIKKDLVKGTNIRKYFFVYFNYFDIDQTPSVFLELSGCHFRLLKQFEELYFQLKDVEMYAPGAVLREEKVVHNGNYGSEFETIESNKRGYAQIVQAINQMTRYVEGYPNSLTNPDFNNTIQGKATFEDHEVIMKNHLEIVPPTPFQPQPIQPARNKLEEEEHKPLVVNRFSCDRIPVKSATLHDLEMVNDAAKIHLPVEHEDTNSVGNSLDSGYTTNSDAEPRLNDLSTTEVGITKSKHDIFSGIAYKETNFNSQVEKSPTENYNFPPVTIIPIDTENDPWQSMALINSSS